MNWKSTLILGAISSTLASIACIIYAKIYSETQLVDFSKVANNISFILSSSIGCFLMASGYKVILAWKGENALGWINIIYSVLSFASIIGVIGYNLPLEIEFPEMFPGLVIPMHFFPILSFLTVYPFFKPNI